MRFIVCCTWVACVACGGSSPGTPDGSVSDAPPSDTAAPDASLSKDLTGVRFLLANNSQLLADVAATNDAGGATANLPFATDRSALIASFQASSNTTVRVGSVTQTSDQTVNDFSSPVTYRVEASDGSFADYMVTVTAQRTRQALLMASNAESSDRFGTAVAISADGTTLAVGAVWEDSAATGVGGDETNNLGHDSGAVYVFTRSGRTWTQQAYVKASNTEVNDHFGASVALSADGSYLAVGAPDEDSGTGIEVDNSSQDSGAVYLFERTTGTWAQEAYVKTPTPKGPGDAFGSRVSLSSDGGTLAVGAWREGSATTGINTTPSGSAFEAGAAYVFARNGTTWTQQAYLKASNTDADDRFATEIDLTADGNTLAVGAPGEDSNATTIGGDETNNTESAAGAAYIFARSGTTWSQQAYIKAANADLLDAFGSAVAVSADGSTAVVTAISAEGGNFSGGTGGLYRFARTGSTWSQIDYKTVADDFQMGTYVALSDDASIVAVTTRAPNPAPNGLAIPTVRVFGWNGSSWSEQSSHTATNQYYADTLSISGDGMFVATGAEENQGPGAAFVYR